jgi:hypothetical protein
LLGWNGVELGGGLFLGFSGHSLLDMTNTFGVAWLTPFSRRRICLEWVFFIDTVVLVALAAALALVLPSWLRNGDAPGIYAMACLSFLAAYVLGKGLLRRRAGKLFPQAKSLVPSALVPWRFFMPERHQQEVVLSRVNALTGRHAPVARMPVLDGPFAKLLEQVPEFRLMREVSPEYHVVSAASDGTGTRLLCRDMRLRNFGTRFGDLEVWLDANRQITRTRFYA